MALRCNTHAVASTNSTRLTVASVIERFHDQYLERYGSSISVEQGLALQSILNCRTKAMGGHRYRCENCCKDHYAWHSCNHRMCPRCGSSDTADWVSAALGKRLPVDYFMVTFTLPEQLRVLCRYAPKPFYKGFFDSAAQAIKDVLSTKKNLGEKAVSRSLRRHLNAAKRRITCGMFGMLQTWQQDLRLHPHIHFIVPGIGIDSKGKIAHLPNPGWLAYGSVFAKRLKTLLLKRIAQEELLSKSAISDLWKVAWNCDVENFGDGENALKYLGQYVFKGPICDTRIVKMDSNRVWFTVKNRDAGTSKTIDIDGVDFVRRYLQHALPPRFHRLRYYGFLHGRSKAKFEKIRSQLEAEGLIVPKLAIPTKVKHSPIRRCPTCKEPLVDTGHHSRAPPGLKVISKIWRRRFPCAA